MFRGGRAIIGDGAAQFEAAGELLRMPALDTCALRKIWRAAGDKIELLGGANDFRVAEIAFSDLVAVFKAVVARGFSREGDTIGLRFDGHKSSAGQSPRADH